MRGMAQLGLRSATRRIARLETGHCHRSHSHWELEQSKTVPRIDFRQVLMPLGSDRVHTGGRLDKSEVCIQRLGWVCNPQFGSPSLKATRAVHASSPFPSNPLLFTLARSS